MVWCLGLMGFGDGLGPGLLGVIEVWRLGVFVFVE